MRLFTKLLLAVMMLSLLLLVACSDDKEGRQSPKPESSETSTTTNDTTETAVSHNALKSSEDGLDIVFSGGGAKSIAQIGAVKEMEEQGASYRRLVGTSSGSIMALFLAAEYSADEMMAAITERTPDGKIILASFMDVPESFDDEIVEESLMFALFDHFLNSFLPIEPADRLDEAALNSLFEHETFREAFSFMEFGGAYAGDEFMDWVREYLDAGGRNLSEATMAEFYEQTGNDLTIIITDITDGDMLIINHRTAPDLPVIWLIRMTTSIPFVYQHVKWQPEWGMYQGEDISGHDIVDGGLGSNMGIELVVSHEPEFVEAMGFEPDPDKVVGLFLDNTIPVAGAEATTPIEEELNLDDPLHVRWNDVKDRNQALFDTFLRAHDHFVVRTHPDKVCHLPVGGFDTLEFDMSEERAQLLMNSGKDAMRDCLQAIESEGAEE